MPEDDPAVAHSNRAGRIYEHLGPERQEEASDEASQAGPAERGEDDHDDSPIAEARNAFAKTVMTIRIGRLRRTSTHRIAMVSIQPPK